MNKMRIYELAKEFNTTSKELLHKIEHLNINANNHMSALEPEEVDKIRNYFYKGSKAIAEEEKKAAAMQSKGSANTGDGSKDNQQPSKPANQQQRPAGNNQQRPAGSNQQRPAGNNQQRPGGNNQQRPAGNNQQRPGVNNQQRPAGNNQQRPQGFNNNNSGSLKSQTKNSIHFEEPKTEQEEIAPVNIKDDVKKVERIGKKPQNNQGRPQGRFNNNRPFNKHGKGGRPHGGAPAPQPKREEPVVKKPIKVGDTISVKDLAEKMSKPVAEIIKKLLMLGIMATINQELDFDTANIIAEDFGIQVERLIDVKSEEVLLKEEEDRTEDLKPRPPIVTIMGHVDHGKTSLLDAIRETNVIATEAGGITQHIGAYNVNIQGKKIAFLDTPGHEAFTAMRARGANVTDIAILVVAADDGVMPQTIEAINHAKAANVSIIVAVNKIDKPGANPDRVKQELSEYGVVAEEWGGDTIMVPVSAKKKEGIDNLLEMILLVAEMLELKANPNKKAKGTVIEAQIDKGRGPVATILIQEGTLNVGDAFVVGHTSGRIRAMVDDKGKRLKKAGPSTPVSIIGLSEVPDAGDIFIVMDDEKDARQIAEKRKDKEKQAQQHTAQMVSLDDLFSQIQEGKMKELDIIVKADVQGSVEAVKQSLVKLSNEEVKVKTIHGGVGAITESDVMLAAASNAIIIGFNVRPQTAAVELAERNKVDIRLYRVIYNAIEDIEAAMKGMLEPEYKEVILGHAEVRTLFKVSSIGTIAGCMVTDGKITRNSSVRLVRNGIVVHEGSLASLKRFKDDVKEVNSGYECGLNLEKYNDVKEGDVIESYVIEAVPRK
ncbi:MAG: translation initiation factor [Clostridia bacterium]|jgi:translation initiation factor IF-2|nr:translation initiation factor [Clostridia bacterium]